MKTWLVSDTHFCHENIIKFMDTRNMFISVEEMNKAIISEWNATVSNQDEVIHLGDFIFGKDLEKGQEIIDNLQFKKLTLVVGNHDTPYKIKNLYSKNESISIASLITNNEFIFTHYPINSELLEETCYRSNGINERYNIHGHVHDRHLQDKRYLNINWDVMPEDNHFIELEEAMNQLKARQ